MSASDLISLVVDAAFGLIALATLVDLARHPDAARLDIALLFSSLAMFIAGSALLRALGLQLSWFSSLSTLVLVAHPYLLLRVVNHFRPLSARVRWAALAGLAVSGLVILITPTGSRSPLLLVLILYFILVEGYAAFEFVRGARLASGGVRWRMAFAAAGAGWFALLILCAGLGLAFSAGSWPYAALTVLATIAELLMVLSYYLGFAPPGALRRAWQLAELHRYLGLLASRSSADPLHSALDLLCPAATRSVGALGSAIYVYAERPAGFVARAADLAGLPATLPEAEAGVVAQAWRERRPASAVSLAAMGAPLAPRLAPLGAVSVLAVPIFDAARIWGVLLAVCARPPLFPVDDQEVLALLAGQAAQAMEIGALFDQQRELVAQLEASNKELEAFSYSVSHDLRAPLRAMDGFSRMLEEDHGAQLDAAGQHYLQRIRSNAKRMGELVDDLLAFSRLGRQPLTLAEVDPAAIARLAWDDLRADRDGRAAELRLEDLPPCLADAALLRQVFINLLSNALKYSRTREVSQVTVGCQTRQPDPLYFVRDNGVGFDAAYASKLFGVFQRLHRADEYEGTGVGLAIVARIVQRHGGQVSADSTLGEGATFYFSLKGAADHATAIG